MKVFGKVLSHLVALVVGIIVLAVTEGGGPLEPFVEFIRKSANELTKGFTPHLVFIYCVLLVMTSITIILAIRKINSRQKKADLELVATHIASRAHDFTLQSRNFIEKTSKTIEDLREEVIAKSRLLETDGHQRWENIKELTIGYAEWYPNTVTTRAKKIDGLAYNAFRDALQPWEELHEFKTHIFTYDEDNNRPAIPWGQLGTVLAQKKVDVIITPIYETNERQHELLFCAPLYYADIGCYVNTEDKRFADKEPLSWNDLTRFLNEIESQFPQIRYISGDIHEKICRKYLTNFKEEKFKDSSLSDIRDFLADLQFHDSQQKMGCSDSDHNTPFIFAESLSVKKYQEENKYVDKDLKPLKNILNPGEYLLPAACVVKPGNTTLKRFINYHLTKYNQGTFQREIDRLINPEEYLECRECKSIVWANDYHQCRQNAATGDIVV